MLCWWYSSLCILLSAGIMRNYSFLFLVAQLHTCFCYQIVVQKSPSIVLFHYTVCSLHMEFEDSHTAKSDTNNKTFSVFLRTQKHSVYLAWYNSFFVKLKEVDIIEKPERDLKNWTINCRRHSMFLFAHAFVCTDGSRFSCYNSLMFACTDGSITYLAWTWCNSFYVHIFFSTENIHFCFTLRWLIIKLSKCIMLQLFI